MAQSRVAGAVARQIDSYAENFFDTLKRLDEHKVWEAGPGASNSVGTLAHHLSGNLRQYLGAGVLEDGYVRDRPGEFSDRGIPVATLTANLREAVEIARRALETVDDAKANAPHRTPDGREFEALSDLLVHLAAHFAYHTGQANYAVRMFGPR